MHGAANGVVQFLGVNVETLTICVAGLFAIALPNGVPAGGRMLGLSSIPTATVTADDFVGNGREGAIPADGVRPCGLHFLPHRLADDTWMSVLHIVLRRFALVWFSGFCQEIHGNLFLEDGIAHIFFVFQNAAYGVWFPPMALPWGENSIVHKNAADIRAADPCESQQIDEPHDPGPGFIDLNFANQAAPVPQKQPGEMIDSLGVSTPNGPGHILGDGTALLFGKGTHQREEKFAGAVHGVDVLPLKIYRYPGGFQLTDGREGIYGISSKTGQRFCED